MTTTLSNSIKRGEFVDVNALQTATCGIRILRARVEVDWRRCRRTPASLSLRSQISNLAPSMAAKHVVRSAIT
jgi:hypothetical protein